MATLEARRQRARRRSLKTAWLTRIAPRSPTRCLAQSPTVHAEEDGRAAALQGRLRHEGGELPTRGRGADVPLFAHATGSLGSDGGIRGCLGGRSQPTCATLPTLHPLSLPPTRPVTTQLAPPASHAPPRCGQPALLAAPPPPPPPACPRASSSSGAPCARLRPPPRPRRSSMRRRWAPWQSDSARVGGRSWVLPGRSVVPWPPGPHQATAGSFSGSALTLGAPRCCCSSCCRSLQPGGPPDGPDCQLAVFQPRRLPARARLQRCAARLPHLSLPCPASLARCCDWSVALRACSCESSSPTVSALFCSPCLLRPSCSLRRSGQGAPAGAAGRGRVQVGQR